MNDLELAKESVRRRVDLVDLISEHVALKRTGRSFTGLCPFHREKTPSFNVKPDLGFFKCFGCGVGGDVFKFIQLIENTDFMSALRMLAERAGVEIQRGPERSAPAASRAGIAKANQWAASLYYRTLRAADRGAAGWAFLEEKGISREMADRFGLGLAPPDGGLLLREAAKGGIDSSLLVAAGLVQGSQHGDRCDVFQDRLLFPIQDSMKRVIGFGGRTLGEARAKYVNTAQNELFDKSRTLYGVHLARGAMTVKRQAIVVEGYTDCIAAHQHGFDNTVATLGTAVTDGHMDVLRRFCSEVLLVFDSDLAGDAAADRAIGVALEHGLRVRLARVPEGKDPCEFLQRAGRDAFADVLNSGVDALGFRWERTLERFRAQGGGSDRRAAMLEFVRFVADLGRYGVLDPIQQGLIATEIAQVVHSSVENVQRLLAQAGAARSRRRSPGATASSAAGASRQRDRWTGPSEAVDAEQAALMTIVGVLVNNPGLWTRAEPVLDPDRIKDPAVRRIAERMRTLGERSGGWETGALLASLERTDEASCLTDLMVREASESDHEAALSDAASRLAEIEATQQARNMWASVEGAQGSGRNEEQTERLQAYAALQRRAKAEMSGRITSRRVIEELRGIGESAVPACKRREEP